MWCLQKAHLGTGQMLSCDDQALNLCCALIDLVDFGIAHQLLCWVLCVESIATKHLLIDKNGISIYSKIPEYDEKNYSKKQ